MGNNFSASRCVMWFYPWTCGAAGLTISCPSTVVCFLSGSFSGSSAAAAIQQNCAVFCYDFALKWATSPSILSPSGISNLKYKSSIIPRWFDWERGWPALSAAPLCPSLTKTWQDGRRGFYTNQRNTSSILISCATVLFRKLSVYCNEWECKSALPPSAWLEKTLHIHIDINLFTVRLLVRFLH